jgi:o-succinylbenzoate---CoA ligase
MDIVGQAAERFAKLAALRTPDGTITYKECGSRARNIASTLFRMGLKPGDIAAIVSPNTPDMALLLLGLLKAGIVAAPLNCRFPRHLIQQTLERLRPKLVLDDTDGMFRLESAGTSSIRSVIEESGRLETDIAFELQDSLERPVSIIHTSASTGVPKAVLHSFSNHWHNAAGSNMNIPFGPADCWLLSLPFYHIGGYAVIFRALASGASMAAGCPGEPVGETLKRFPVTHLSLVPTQLHRLLADPETSEILCGMKAVLLGGSGAPASLVDKAARQGVPLYLSYGSTEMASQISTTRKPVTSMHQDSGHVLPFREVSEAEDGELLVRGRCLFAGYLSEGVVLPQTDSEGWFHTSDIGHVTADGMVTVLGRKDNMFISGGENIHPEEVEKALMTIQGIEEALVVPVTDEEYGQRPMAFIKRYGENLPADEELDRIMRTLVGKLKAPRRYQHIDAWETLPGSQKIDRSYYRRLAGTG